MLTLAAVGVALTPLLVVTALLLLSARLQHARRRRAALQVAVTDALDRELGPVVAPVVGGRRWRTRELRISLPLERAAIAGRVLAIAHRALDEDRATRRLPIVLVPQAASGRR
jgi:hypothetical protein